jgi:hypothetical protein
VPLDGAARLHNTPALINHNRVKSSITWMR